MKYQPGLTGCNHLARHVGRTSRLLNGPVQIHQLRPIHNTRIHATSQTAPLQSVLTTHEDHSNSIARSDRFANALPFSSFLTDKHARQHTYLRISLTERCNLRCTYCMPEAGVPLSPQSTQLTTPEILLLSSLFVSQGVNKIRLTGGEPTVRKDIVPLMQQLGELRANGLKELCITSNGVALKNKLESMHKAGLTGVNLSLDTLDPNLFMIMARRPGFSKVIESMERILAMNKMGAGIALKVNVVVMKGVNESEILRFVELGKDKDLEVRFIEYMPFDGNRWSKNKMVSYQDMLHTIRQRYPELEKVVDKKGDTSKSYRVPGFAGRVGFITSMTENFCSTCNRLRITSDGNLKVCLFGNSEVSLRDLMRKGNDGQAIDEEALAAIKAPQHMTERSIWQESEHELLHAIGLAVGRKEAQHDSMDVLKETKNRPMILIDDYIRTTINRRPQQPRMLGQLDRPILNNPALWQLSQPSFQRLIFTTAKRQSIDEPPRLPGDISDESSSTAADNGENSEPVEFASNGTSFINADEGEKSLSLDNEQNSTTDPKSLYIADDDGTTQHNDRTEDALTQAYQFASQTEEELGSLLSEVKLLISQQKNSTSTTDSQNIKPGSTARNDGSRHAGVRRGSTDSDNSDSGSLPLHPQLGNYPKHQSRVSRSPPTRLTHLDDQSAVHMVSIVDKPVTKRKAIAIGSIYLPYKTAEAIARHAVEKGDVLGVARIAAIQGVKKTSDLIPLCHPGLSIEGIKVDINLIILSNTRSGLEKNTRNELPSWLSRWLETKSRHRKNCIKMAVTVESSGRTGIEMEALTGVNAGLLTVYDMCKSMSKEMVINSRVAFKSGGRSGTWTSSIFGPQEWSADD